MTPPPLPSLKRAGIRISQLDRQQKDAKGGWGFFNETGFLLHSREAESQSNLSPEGDEVYGMGIGISD